MLTTKSTPLSREQFFLLRESKRLVAAEFEKDLKIQDKDILDQLTATLSNLRMIVCLRFSTRFTPAIKMT